MSAQPKPAASTKVVTGRVRASYVNVFEPRRNELSGKDEYSMMLLIPKSDTATVTALRAAFQAAIAAKWGAKPPPALRLPLRDGDAEHPDEDPYVGHWFCNVKSSQRPGVVDAQVQDVIDPVAFVSGDFCRVSVNAYAYDQKGNRGVALGLNNVQVLGRGEPLSSRARAQDDFGAVAETAEEDF